MLLGARQFFERRGGGWQNPYATDGLVAMWDGIWNVGGGLEHDGSARVWRDCVGGLPIIGLTSNVAFVSTGLQLGLSTSYNDHVYGVAPGGTAQYGWRFAEFVFTSDANISNQYPAVFLIGSRMIWLNFSAQSIGVTASDNKSWTAVQAFQKGSAFSIAVDYSDFTSPYGSKVWQSSQPLAHTGPSDSWQYRYGANGMGSFYSNNYPFAGTYHAIRLYNRELTQNEVEEHYAIDKQRFNLP